MVSGSEALRNCVVESTEELLQNQPSDRSIRESIDPLTFARKPAARVLGRTTMHGLAPRLLTATGRGRPALGGSPRPTSKSTNRLVVSSFF